MSALQSNLSAPGFGYDVVVATTQRSINSILKTYFSKADLPEASMYYVKNQVGDPVEVPREVVLNRTAGVDPFNIPAWDGTGTKPDAITMLHKSQFLFAFKAKQGNPSGYPLFKVPDVIKLLPGTQSVVFNLMCSSFTIAAFNYNDDYITNYLNQTQPDGDAWIFAATLGLKAITDNTNLPDAVQKQVNNMHGAVFSVQQLIFDLDTAMPYSTPTITGIAPGSSLYNALTTGFVEAYFNTMRSFGAPVLNYSVTQSTADSSSLPLSAVSLYAGAFVDANGMPENAPTTDQQNLSALNHLCATRDNTLPPAKQFNWNWLDNDNDAANYNGVIAINRNTLADHFKRNGLNQYVFLNCRIPSVTVITNSYNSGNFPIQYADWYPALGGGGEATVTIPPTGSTVLAFSYQSETAYGADTDDIDIGQMWLTSSFNLTVDFIGNAIIVKQHYLVAMKTEVNGSTEEKNVIDKSETDTYTVIVDVTGNLGFHLTSAVADHSQTLASWQFWPHDSTRPASSLVEWLSTFNASWLSEEAFTSLHSFIFPGGNTFAFKDAQFSNNQDLICHITYTNTY